MSYYSFYNNGLRVGDYIIYNIVNSSLSRYTRSCKEHTGIVIYRKYLFSSNTKWGERKFFNYKIYNNTNRVLTLDTRYIKLIKCIGIDKS